MRTKEQIQQEINAKQAKLNNTYDSVERCVLTDDIAKLRNELNALEYPAKKHVVKANIDVPVVGDRKPESTRSSSFRIDEKSTYVRI